MGLRTSHKCLTKVWAADVAAVEAAISQFAVHRPVTNDCQVVLFELERDEHLHVNVTHKRPTRTLRGWAGPAKLPGGFVHNRVFADSEAVDIIGEIRRMVFADGPQV